MSGAVANSKAADNIAALQSQQKPETLQTVQIEQPVEMPQKKQAKRYFISGANSLLGHALFEELRNDHIAI